MKTKIFFCFLLFCVFFSFASSGSKIFNAVDSKTPFSGDRLFAVLDSVGGTGTWMEWDVNGVRDPSAMSALTPLLAKKNPPKMVWVLSERSKPLLSVLLPKGAGEVIVFYELQSLDAKPEALKLNPVLTPKVVFRDYKQVAPGEFVHMDRPNLKISANEKRIRFTYEKLDAEPLRFDADFKGKTFVEKRAEVRDYMDFLKYEFSLMLRAFVQSTRGLFNWQPWHWYMPEWNSRGFIKEEEIEAMLESGIKPNMFSVFKLKALGGEVVELKTSGNGFYEMTITNP